MTTYGYSQKKLQTRAKNRGMSVPEYLGHLAQMRKTRSARSAAYRAEQRKLAGRPPIKGGK